MPDSNLKPLHLVVRKGQASPQVLSLRADEPVTMGRDDGCDLVLGGDRASRKHARVVVEAGRWVLEDCGSATGTKLDGVFVEREALLAGAKIELGGVTLEVVDSLEGAVAVASSGAGHADKLLQALTGLLVDEGGAGVILGKMLDGLLESFEADRGVVFVPEGDGFVEASRRFREDAPGSADEPISRTLVARVAGSAEALLSTSLETAELREEHASIPAQLRSLLASPLPLPGGSGVLYLDSVIDRKRFTDEDRRLLTAFAQAAGVSLARERERRDNKRHAANRAEIARRAVGQGDLVGSSPAMRGVLDEVERAGSTDVTVLVTGESGTGKELIARALHAASPRAAGPFVALNCAAIPSELVESELFGHEKGAFTGADTKRQGHFELADGGTLFLDEVGELPAAVQGKLLRALQERTIQRVGGKRPVRVDFRLVCATNVDLEGAITAGTFREDLFYRIAVFRLALPPLRDRGDDVVQIARSFLEKFAREFRREISDLSPDGMAALRAHGWPGNVRELRNVVEQAVVREDSPQLTAASLFPARAGASSPAPAVGAAPPVVGAGGGGITIGQFPSELDPARREFERQFLEHHLAANGGNMKATSEAINLSRRNLYAKCDEYGIDYKRFR